MKSMSHHNSCCSKSVKIAAFALHACASLAILGVLFGCDTVRFGQRTTKMRPFDWQPWKAGPGRNATCNSREQCYRDAVPWADDEQMPGYKWNPYVLVFVFEWISASFALYYLRDLDLWRKCMANARSVFTLLPIVWNVIGASVYVGWIAARDAEGKAEIVVVFASFTVACVVLGFYERVKQRFMNIVAISARNNNVDYDLHVLNGRTWKVPKAAQDAQRRSKSYTGPDAAPLLESDGWLVDLADRLDVVLRYSEYSITASLLYVAVLSVFVVEPPGWMVICGYASIFACNVFGIPLHVTHLLLEAYRPPGDHIMRYDVHDYVKGYTNAVWAGRAGRFLSGLAALFAIGKWHDFWTCKLTFLGGCWLGLTNGLLIIFYVARGYLFSADLPGFVLFALWNLVVTYASFGVAGTVFYVFPRTWRYMDVTLDILSLSAKLPIAVDVCVAFLQMPGGGCKI